MFFASNGNAGDFSLQNETGGGGKKILPQFKKALKLEVAKKEREKNKLLVEERKKEMLNEAETD
jgi:hypothetical protein